MNNSIHHIQTALQSGACQHISALFTSEHPADIAAVLQKLPPQAAWRALDYASISRRADIFSYLVHDYQSLLATVIPRAALATVVMEMKADDRADLYQKLSADQRETLMPALAQAEREDIRQLTSYSEGTAGSVMTSEYAALPRVISATAALTLLRQEAPDAETINRAYIVDENRKLLGTVRLQDIITAPHGANISDIMDTNTHAIRVSDDEVAAARWIAHYDMIALPVIDDQDHLVGIITHDDALDVLEAEATDDFHRVATITNLGTSVARLLKLILSEIGSARGISKP